MEGIEKIKTEKKEKSQEEGEGMEWVSSILVIPAPFPDTVQTWPDRRLHCRLRKTERYKTLQRKAIRGKAHERRTGIL